MREIWKITSAFVVSAAAAGAAWWMVQRDTEADSESAAGNTAWMLGAFAVVVFAYALYLVFRDVEEVIEHEVQDHDLQHLESFEPTLFHWALGAAAVVVLVALLL
ncbi:MAG: hypothetical protein Q7V57_06240 [Actinomycetota bacterium]|nr:hypothetical protein [Actinomycetota bacterium]